LPLALVNFYGQLDSDKSNPNSITERRVPGLIPVLGRSGPIWSESCPGRQRRSQAIGAVCRASLQGKGGVTSPTAVATVCVLSAVRRLDVRSLRMSDQPPALFGQLSGIAYCRRPATTTTTTAAAAAAPATGTAPLATTPCSTFLTVISLSHLNPFSQVLSLPDSLVNLQ